MSEHLGLPCSLFECLPTFFCYAYVFPFVILPIQGELVKEGEGRVARVKTTLSISGSGRLLTSNIESSWLHLGPVQQKEDETLPSSVFRALCLRGILLVLNS